jgi:hypothetical protein
LKQRGGAATFKPGQDGDNENVRVLVNPKQMKLATELLKPKGNVWSDKRWEGQFINKDDWEVRAVTPAIAAWHEFGHAWRYMNTFWFKMLPITWYTNRTAVEWENRMRERIYVTFGPDNARRLTHD